ncbi:hypothetical protein [Desulfobacula sp.]|uniref:hypothetical protein n=1 Tax=Desulfobacula sp. TaxID=2593537 RepID=UPI0026124C8D|nr:hypothetical protein [Desulfobacula sp.]
MEVVTAGHINLLLNRTDIHDILPVGSKGIQVEANQLAQSVHCIFKATSTPLVDLNKSGGPSTCIIFTCRIAQDITCFENLPLSEVGIFI